jgi:hypothetical protein
MQGRREQGAIGTALPAKGYMDIEVDILDIMAPDIGDLDGRGEIPVGPLRGITVDVIQQFVLMDSFLQTRFKIRQTTLFNIQHDVLLRNRERYQRLIYKARFGAAE